MAANAQPLWAAHEGQMDVLTIPFLGDRWRWQYPFRSLRAAGAVLAMGSDWSVSTPEPAAGRWSSPSSASTPTSSRGDAEAFLPDERIELIDALAAFTAGSAYVNHLDETPARSRSASWPTWPSSIATCSTAAPGAIGEARVVGTFVEGDAVFEDPALEG